MCPFYEDYGGGGTVHAGLDFLCSGSQILSALPCLLEMRKYTDLDAPGKSGQEDLLILSVLTLTTVSADSRRM